MKIIIDENIEYGKEAFSEFGSVVSINGREISQTICRDADVLIVRSITNVDEKLLSQTNIKFVGTATIGTDHIDLEYLSENQIKFSDAKGCNANAVKEYVLTAILKGAVENKFQISGKSIGVVGIGNIGSIVSEAAELLGMNVIKNDPPRQRESVNGDFKSLDEALTCDIVTFHVPLNLEGADRTYHLINSDNIHKINNCSMVINSSRGPVINNAVFAEFLKENKKLFSVLDVWENEPNLNPQILSLVDIATPHIAGYTLEGKANGTKLIYDSLCQFLERVPVWKPNLPAVENGIVEVETSEPLEIILNNIFTGIYQIQNDTELLKASIDLTPPERGKYFDRLRKNYNLRREFSNYSIKLNPYKNNIAEVLEGLNFQIVN